MKSFISQRRFVVPFEVALEGLFVTRGPRARHPATTMSRDDDNSSKIAEKLLQGWTMLAEYCPADGCMTPLMRGRDGRRFCVAHDMFVMSSEEAEEMKRKGGGVGGGDAPAAKASPSSSAPAPSGSEPSSLDRIDFYSQLRAGRSPAPDPEPLARGYGDDGAAPMTLDRDGGGRGADDGDDLEIGAIARSTRATVAAKMEEARAALARSESFSESAELMRFIRECLETARACDGI